MDVTIEQVALTLLVTSEILSLIPEKYVKSNGILHSFIVIIGFCNEKFQTPNKHED